MARKTVVRFAAVSVMVLLAGCFGGARRDGVPPGRLDPDNIRDAEPKRETITRAGNKSPYTVFGKTYTLLPSSKGYRARGVASWYGSKFHGGSTANGEKYDAMAMTAAHTTLPIPSYVQVINLENGRTAVVRVNDRGPFVDNRIIDLSYAAATKLGYANKGIARVEVVAIDVDNWAPGARNAALYVPTPRVTQLPSTSASAPAPAPSSGNRDLQHYVQAGAFANADAANNLRRQLEQSTGKAVDVRPTASAPVLYRVRIGPFASRDQAEQVRSNLATRDARIVSE